MTPSAEENHRSRLARPPQESSQAAWRRESRPSGPRKSWTSSQVLREQLRLDDSPGRLRRLHRLATTPSGDGSLPPFALAVAQYLERKLRGRGLLWR